MFEPVDVKTLMTTSTAPAIMPAASAPLYDLAPKKSNKTILTQTPIRPRTAKASCVVANSSKPKFMSKGPLALPAILAA